MKKLMIMVLKKLIMRIEGAINEKTCRTGNRQYDNK